MTRFFTMLLIVFGLTVGIFAQSGDRNTRYIAQYKDLAMKEMLRVKIPASISLAQAIIESAGGESSMAREANNHFGIKCHNDWTGERYYLRDDDRDASGEIIESCFRKYRDPYQSWKDHSDYLVNSRRYAELFTYDIYDYKRWANGLRNAGYATLPTYGEKLIDIIDRYQLYQYDYQAGGGMANNNPTGQGRVATQKINGVPVVFASNGQSLNDIAIATNIKASDLRKYNERILVSESAPLPDGYKVYVKKKKFGTTSNKRFHTVMPGETMFSISQLYGIRLGALYQHCRMKPGTQPAVGQKVALKFSFFGPPNKINTRTPSPIDDAVTPTNKPTTVPQPTPNTPPVVTPTYPQTGGIIKDANSDGMLDMDIIPGGVISPNAPAPVIPRQGGTPTDTSTGNVGGENPRPNTPAGTKPSVPTKPTPLPGQPGADTSVGTGTKPTTSTQTPPPPVVNNPNYYIVQKSDTLYSLSRKFGLTVDQLKKMNNITTDSISIGQQLRIK